MLPVKLLGSDLIFQCLLTLRLNTFEDMNQIRIAIERNSEECEVNEFLSCLLTMACAAPHGGECQLLS